MRKTEGGVERSRSRHKFVHTLHKTFSLLKKKIHADSSAQDLGLILCPTQDMARARSCAWFWHRIKYAQELGIAISCAWQDRARTGCGNVHILCRAQDCAHTLHILCRCAATSCAHPVPAQDAETDPVRMFHCVGCAVCALEALRGHTGGKQCRRHLPRSCAQDPVLD